jgi:hypothetical protein
MINSNGANMNHLRKNSNATFNQNNSIHGFNNGTNYNIMNNNGNINGVLGMIKNNNNFGGNTLPKANNNGPFRNLFSDDGIAQSPQFKNI